MNTLTPLEQRAADMRKNKFGTNSLQWERSEKAIITPSLDPVPVTDKWHKIKMAEYQQRYGISSFELEGQVKPTQTTLEDASIVAEKARLKANHATLRTCTASVNGQKHRFWFELSI